MAEIGTTLTKSEEVTLVERVGQYYPAIIRELTVGRIDQCIVYSPLIPLNGEFKRKNGLICLPTIGTAKELERQMVIYIMPWSAQTRNPTPAIMSLNEAHKYCEGLNSAALSPS